MMHSPFMDVANKSSVIQIYPTTILNIDFDEHGIRTRKKFNISIDKTVSKNLLQIRLCDENDSTKMFISTIDNGIFDQLKLEQSLNVTFEGFVDHLTKILDSCKRNELFVHIQQDTQNCVCQFYEKRPFRDLVHLYLPIQAAPIAVVLFHINQSLAIVQHQSNLYASQVNKLQAELQFRDDHIRCLKKDLKNADDRLVEHENLALAHSNEQCERLRTEIKQISESKDAEAKKLNSVVKTLQEKAEHLSKENLTANERYFQEKSRSDALRDEIQQQKQNNFALREQNDKLHSEILAFKSQERRTEHLLTEARKQINDLQEKFNAADKRNSDLNAILEAEKKICQTKKTALQIATDEISKANSIIIRQNREIGQLKEKNDWRAELVLQQEKTIQQMEGERKKLQEYIKTIEINSATENQPKEFADKLNEITNIAEQIEKKYSKKINDLSIRLQQVVAEKNLNKSTNRYLQISNRIDPF